MKLFNLGDMKMGEWIAVVVVVIGIAFSIWAIIHREKLELG